MELIIKPGGDTLGIWTDDFDARVLGMLPERASRIEVIKEPGPHCGEFHVDFSLLADAVGDNSLRVCLVKTFRSYKEGVASEVQWLKDNWLTRKEIANAPTS